MSGKYINRLPRGMPADQTRALSDVFQDLHRDAMQFQAEHNGAVLGVQNGGLRAGVAAPIGDLNRLMFLLQYSKRF